MTAPDDDACLAFIAETSPDITGDSVSTATVLYSVLWILYGMRTVTVELPL